MKDTIFIDFDGVIRLWSGKEIEDSEKLAGVAEGTLLSVAFSPKYLSPAIDGRITHEEWVTNVGSELTEKYQEGIAQQLLLGWSNASWEINLDLLEQLKKHVPHCKLVLVTNATTKLSADLEQSGLKSTLDIVVNSADIGVFKPDVAFYHNALSKAGTTVQKSIFIDDSLSHIDTAISVGIDSIQHKDNSSTIGFVKQKCT